MSSVWLATLRHVAGGAYAHLAHRTFNLYWQARAPKVLGALSVTEDDTILDLGCGQGLWTSWLASRSTRTVAIDIAFEDIKAARLWRTARPALEPSRSVHWCLASGEHLPFRDGTFTKILAADVMDVIPDHESAASEMHRVLKRHGVVVLTNLLQSRRSVFIRVEPDQYVREYDATWISDLLESGGLSVTRVFHFYYLFGMASRELQIIAQASVLRRVPVLLLLVQAALSLVGRLDSLLPLGAPAGIGVVARKAVAPPRTPHDPSQRAARGH